MGSEDSIHKMDVHICSRYDLYCNEKKLKSQFPIHIYVHFKFICIYIHISNSYSYLCKFQISIHDIANSYSYTLQIPIHIHVHFEFLFLYMYISNSYSYICTFQNFYSFCILQGMASSMSGPALPSLRRRINVNTEEISLILTANSLGSVAGNLPLGILGDLLGDHLDLIVSLSWVLGAAGCLLVPFATSLVSMVIFFFIMGLGLMCGVIGGKNIGKSLTDM